MDLQIGRIRPRLLAVQVDIAVEADLPDVQSLVRGWLPAIPRSSPMRRESRPCLAIEPLFRRELTW